MFSTLKYVNSSNFEIFRNFWNAKYLGGFVVHSKAFDGLAGNFPIGFLIWSTNQFAVKRNPILEIITDVLDKSANPVGEKRFYNIPSSLLLSQWIKRPKANKQNVIPLKGAITPATSTKDLRGTKWADNAIACLIMKGPDVQNASTQAIISSGYGSAGSIFITPDNLWKAAVIFAVRGLVKPTWINNRDQFLQPSESLTEEFKNDCLIWMLFSKSNLTASADGLKWNDMEWSIVNHFIPFPENEVNSNDRFESDFMVRYLRGKTLSMESKEVLNSGKILWRNYFNTIDVRSVREDLKLNRADVGWYQVRKALQSRNTTGNALPVNFDFFNSAYNTLTNKLIPLIYDYGFLKI